jgi:predicted signal transduction protein with EAL and GGDEF domain
MGVRVVMEGIEDESEAEACRTVGADRGQGYLFGRPTPWAQAAHLIVDMAARPDETAARPEKTAARPQAAAARPEESADAG